MPQKIERVVILGGGVGALCAAVGLTEVNKKRRSNKSSEPLYDIHLYQRGWRLGGKCASGRNEELGQRIEEHGLHIWAGFYTEAFSVMKTVINDLNERGLNENGAMSLENLFKRQNMILFRDRQVTDRLVTLPLYFQPNSSQPDAFPGVNSLWLQRDAFPSPSTVLSRITELLKVALGISGEFKNLPADLQNGLSMLEELPDELISELIELWEKTQNEDSKLHPVIEFLDFFINDEKIQSVNSLYTVSELATLVFEWTQTHRNQLVKLNPQMSMLVQVAEFVIASIVQSIKYNAIRIGPDGKLQTEFTRIDNWDIKAFLEEFDPILADNSVLLALFDYAFAFKDGDFNSPTASACSVLEAMIQLMLGYREGFFFKGLRGMGDILGTPIFKYLVANGTTFHFFHEVKELVPTQDGMKVDSIHLLKQAKVSGDNLYDPLVTVSSEAGSGFEPFDCWPSEPLWDQLENPDKTVDYESIYGPQPEAADSLVLERTKTLGDGGFDHVIFGISAGALNSLCPKMFEQKPWWKGTLGQMQTTRTQAFQVWFNEDMKTLNSALSPSIPDEPFFGNPADNIGPIVALCPEPFDTYSDMSQTLPAEAWPSSLRPKNVAYFCSPMKDKKIGGAPNDQTQANSLVESEARKWLDTNGPMLFPGLFQNDTDQNLNTAAIHFDPAGCDQVSDPLGQQYFRANIDPSERYVLSPPGNLNMRTESWNTGYSNLSFAGDWTKVAHINAGCVECAAMSGLDAAAALSREPITAETASEQVDVNKTFIEYGYTLYPPPAKAVSKNSWFHGFVFEAQREKLHDFLDKFLNRAAGYKRFQPIGEALSQVSNTFTSLAEIFEPLRDKIVLAISRNPDFSSPLSGYDFGAIAENDIGFWIPVAEFTRDNRMPIGYGMVPVYLFVDRGYAMICGRELWGMPKQYAEMTLPNDISDPFGPFVVNIYGLEALSPNSVGKDLSLLSLTGKANTEKVLQSPLDGTPSAKQILRCIAGQAVAESLQLEHALNAVGELGQAGVSLWPNFYMLKQFRSAESLTQACYQETIRAQVVPTKIKSMTFRTGSWTLNLPNVADIPIARDLGLINAHSCRDTSVNLHTDSCFSAEIDYSLSSGLKV
jgi:uncharacterized protein with NAD-binding domain and iron-sulfur cluster